MIDLELNGEQLPVNLEGLVSFEDIIASIRQERSPDEVVSSAWWNGSPLSEIDLDRDPHKEKGVLSVHTRRRREYVDERLGVATRYVTQVADSFQQSVHAFRTGHSGYGNTFLARGIDELLSFIAWYSTIIGLESDSSKSISSEPFFEIVRSLQRNCEHLVSAQLLESSFTIATSLEGKIIPELVKLRQCCQQVVERHLASDMENA